MKRVNFLANSLIEVKCWKPKKSWTSCEFTV